MKLKSCSIALYLLPSRNNTRFCFFQNYDGAWYILKELKPSTTEEELPFDQGLDKLGTTISDKNGSKETSVTADAKELPDTGSGDSDDSVSLGVRSQVRTDEGLIACIQRPEPLGKAKGEIHMAKVSTSLIDNGLNIGSNTPAFTGSSTIASESSDDGLNEQDFPVRVPLSISEGDNSTPTVVVKQPSTSISKSIELSPKNASRPLDNDAYESHTMSKVSDEVKDTGLGLKSDQQVLSTVDAEAREEPGTPISTLLEPTYKSSTALLEELRKRRLHFDRIAENTADKGRFKSDDMNPFELAESAMKASNILSRKTAKSLKKASIVLKAVEEHRSPPSDISSSLSSGSSGIQSISKSREDSDIFLSTGSSSKDSIDVLLAARLKKDMSLSRTSDGRLAENMSCTAESSTALIGNSQGASLKSSEATAVFEAGRLPLTSRSISSYSSKTSPMSISNSATSSELLQLEGATSDFDSSLMTSVADRFKAKTDDISPIETQNRASANLGSRNFRSSSRIQSGRIARFKRDVQVSDAEIVELHRSLGAGTITPLPVSRIDARYEMSSNDASFTSSKKEQGALGALSHESGFSSRSECALSDTVTNVLSQDSTAGKDDSRIKGGDRTGKDTGNSKEKSQDSAEEAPRLKGADGSTFRGIYDIRDSTGPGSTNRRRLLSGKHPVQLSKTIVMDPFDVYVTEESKSDLSFVVGKESAREHGKKTQTTRKDFIENSKLDVKEDAWTGTDTSSMSSELPVLSYEAQTLSVEKRETNQRDRTLETSQEFISARKKRDAAHTDKNWKDREPEVMYSRAENDKTNSEASHKMAMVGKVGTRSSPHKDLNRLWEKFRDNFDRDRNGSSSEVLGKIEKLNELLHQNSGFREKRSIEDQGIFRKPRPLASAEVIAHSSKVPAERKTELKVWNSPCPNCGKRNAETNCPSPTPFETPASEPADEQPLLLHMWTQTTPNVYVSKKPDDSILTHTEKKDSVAKPPYSVPQSTNTSKELITLPEKENIQLKANSPKDVLGSFDGEKPSSWNVVFEEKPKSIVVKQTHAKPPVPHISRKMVHNEPVRKKKEPVFTAWFQSTRSDTSSGTVVPLSTIPKLADAYKEGKRMPEMQVKEINTKNTE